MINLRSSFRLISPIRHQARHFASPAGKQYDLVVIGGGPGGYVAAIKAGQLGLSVACVEFRGSLGGTCLNVGCIPSKALLNATHHYHDAKHNLPKWGITPKGFDVDVSALQNHKVKTVTTLTKGIEHLFKKNKVDYIKGFGSIESPTSVKVISGLEAPEALGTPKPSESSLSGGVTQPTSLSTKNILIATGSVPAALPGVEIDEEVVVTSTGALNLKTIPKKMIVIGGGVIGLEMGSVYSRLGSEVHVVEYLDRIVPGVDKDVADQFQKTLTKQGFKFHLGKKVLGSKKTASGVQLQVAPAKGGDAETLEADVVLVSTGRRPYTEKLGLESVGIKLNERKQVPTDHHFRTSVPSIYAIGDVIAGPMLAHKAEEEGIAAVEIIAGKAGHVNYDAIPGVIYTWPEVATVGKTEDELKSSGAKYKVGRFPFAANSRAKANDDTEGFIKVLADAETDRILGMHIIGPNAGELIAEAVLAIEYGASSEDVARTCHAHPTLSEAVKEACMATYDKPIHF